MEKERNKFKKVIVITGTPSVGKTVVSQGLATKLGALHIDLAETVKHEKLTNGYDKRRQTWITDTKRLAKRLQQIIKQEKSSVIIDGHYAPIVIPRAQITMIFVLRCHPQHLREQMKKRGFKGTKLWENLAAEILDVCLHDAVISAGREKVCEIDTTNKTVEDTINEILSILSGKASCSVGIIDWLGAIEEEKSLDEYLRNF